MPLRDTLHRGEQAIIGAALRGVACRHPAEAGELLTIADRIDPEHCEDDMSRRGHNIRYVLDRLAAADAEVARLNALTDNLQAAIIGFQSQSAGDAEDQAAEADLEAVVAANEAMPAPTDDSTAPPGDATSAPATPNLIDQV